MALNSSAQTFRPNNQDARICPAIFCVVFCSFHCEWVSAWKTTKQEAACKTAFPTLIFVLGN